jgi:hypothetical protein
MVFLDEHKGWIEYEAYEVPRLGLLGKRMKLRRTHQHKGEQWKEIVISNFLKIRVTCKCAEKPPLKVSLEFEGPWTTEQN